MLDYFEGLKIQRMVKIEIIYRYTYYIFKLFVCSILVLEINVQMGKWYFVFFWTKKVRTLVLGIEVLENLEHFGPNFG